MANKDHTESESGKRSYTMSDKALQARRDNAQLSTGPKTEEGKAASSRNNWKHGEYSILTKSAEWQALAPIAKATGKPCQTTCEQYPCSLVDEGMTSAGQNCMDKTVFVMAFDAIMSTLHSGDDQHAHGMLAMTAASAMDVFMQMRDEIGERGVIMESDVFNKDGDVSGTKYFINPAIKEFTKLLHTMGINMPEMLATPQAAKKVKSDEEVADTLGELLGGMTERFGMRKKPGRTIDGEVEKI
ncbi:MAG: hypothetical protein HUJ30_02345 [Gammaproteobacteria bacterium]|nr:hypothetical protein [Gammaproteobacteria bacterium]